MRSSTIVNIRLPLFALLTTLAVGPAPAAITWSGTQNIAIPTTFDGVYLSFTNPSDATVVSIAFSEPTDWDVNFFYGGTAIGTSNTFLPATDTGGINSNIERYDNSVVIGDGVGDGDTFVTGFSGSTGHMGTNTQQFTSGAPGYFGFQIDDGASGHYYGWMLVTLKGDGSNGTIHQWAWDTSGDPIQVGAIPEPGNGLVGLLIAAALLRRRR